PRPRGRRSARARPRASSPLPRPRGSAARASPPRRPPLAAVVRGEQLEGAAVTAQHGAEGAPEGALVERIVGRLNHHLAPDQGQPDLAPVLDVHRLCEVPGDQDSEASADPPHAPTKGHVLVLRAYNRRSSRGGAACPGLSACATRAATDA